MSTLDPAAGWPDIDGINTSERLLGGPSGPLNRAPSGLVARTKQLRDWREADQAELIGNTGAAGVGWARSPLTDTIVNSARWMDAQQVQLYEFANLVTDRPSADPTTWDWTPAFAAVAALPDANAVALNLPPHAVRITDTVVFSRGVLVRGQGLYRSRIVMTDDTKYAINFSMPTTRFEYFELQGVTVEAKRGLVTRYLEGADITNAANPSRSLRVIDCRFSGKYVAAADPLAGSDIEPTFAELQDQGTALRLVMVYGALVEGCIFENYGIAIANLGCTLSLFPDSRFVSNCRHIHEERIPWYNSAFGMGADNRYVGNDLLDGRRFGSVSFVNSFGTEFKHNYNESLVRGGASSSPMSFDFRNTSGVQFTSNHINANLSVTLAKPFLRFRSSRVAALNADTTGNVITDNRLTPFSSVNSATVDITANFNAAYPEVLRYSNNISWPVLSTANIATAPVRRDTFAFNNLVNRMGLGGALSTAEDLWQYDAAQARWYIKSLAQNLIFNLTCDNPQLGARFALVFDVDDIAASGGNGRLSATVTDSDGAVLVSAQVIAGVTAPRRATVVVTSAVLEARKTLKVDLGSTANIKVQSVRLEALTQNEAAKVWDPPSIAAAGTAQTTLTVPGAELGDRCSASFSLNIGSLLISSAVTSANTIAVTLYNPTLAAVDLASGTLVGSITKSQKY